LGPGALLETGRATCHRRGRLLDQSGHEDSGRMVGKVDWPFCDQSPRVTSINNYSRHLLSNWRANMDLQLIGNSLGAAEYAGAYVSKAEPDTLRFRRVITKAVKRCDPNLPYHYIEASSQRNSVGPRSWRSRIYLDIAAKFTYAQQVPNGAKD